MGFAPKDADTTLVAGDELLVALRSEDLVLDVLVTLDVFGADLDWEVLRAGSGAVESRVRGSEGHLGRSGLTAHCKYDPLGDPMKQEQSGNKPP